MRLVTLHALALLYCGAVVAQDCINVALTAIPGCAQNCILNGAPSIGCQGTDFSCQCAQSAALYAAVEGCVSSACPSASYQAVIDGSEQVCDCAAPVGAGLVAAGTASVSGSIGSSIASNTATATGSSPTATSGSAGGSTGGGSGATGTPTGGSGNTWTGYSSVSPIATASVVGAVAQATPVIDVIRYVVPVVMMGAVVL
ncbi:hypothetical protein Daus18300_012811 [Diaporthe australafricana]|uniref:CFEM domain-containing protein n=1 Tax=Diaporthe australafricana TaxID=127596 RepID=A0ABR3W1K7_9PEZI